jgi:hypothetical protein
MPLLENFEGEVLQKEFAEVKEITKEDAENLIMKYEWLPTFGRSIIKSYGLYYHDELIGAISFRRPYTLNSSKFLFGREYADIVCVLQRGACIPSAPHNSSSYLISQGCNMLRKSTSYRAIIAYGDEDAGEIGTVYQSQGWMYTGTTGGKAEFIYTKNGAETRMDGRGARGFAKRNGLPKPSMKRLEGEGRFAGKSSLKHRYVTIIGARAEKKSLKKLMRVEVLEYPHRKNMPKKHNIALAKEGKEMDFIR